MEDWKLQRLKINDCNNNNRRSTIATTIEDQQQQRQQKFDNCNNGNRRLTTTTTTTTTENRQQQRQQRIGNNNGNIGSTTTTTNQQQPTYQACQTAVVTVDTAVSSPVHQDLHTKKSRVNPWVPSQQGTVADTVLYRWTSCHWTFCQIQVSVIKTSQYF